jgi:hypothetical protein
MIELISVVDTNVHGTHIVAVWITVRIPSLYAPSHVVEHILG